jgi:hypothetical protein
MSWRQSADMAIVRARSSRTTAPAAAPSVVVVSRPPNEIGGKTQVRVHIIQCHIVQLDKSRVGA